MDIWGLNLLFNAKNNLETAKLWSASPDELNVCSDLLKAHVLLAVPRTCNAQEVLSKAQPLGQTAPIANLPVLH